MMMAIMSLFGAQKLKAFATLATVLGSLGLMKKKVSSVQSWPEEVTTPQAE